MAAMDVRQALHTALENRKTVARTIDKADRKERRGRITVFVLLAVAMALEAFHTASVNMSLANALSDPHLQTAYKRAAVWLSSAQALLAVVGILLVPILAKYLLVLFGYLYLPVDAAVTCLASRRRGYRDFHRTYKQFMEPKQAGPFQLIAWIIMSFWLVPAVMLWPAHKLGMSPDAFLSLVIYGIALIGCGALWYGLNNAFDKVGDEKAEELAAWLHNPAGLKDFIDLPLLMAAFLLFFAFLVWPTLDYTLKQVKQGAAGVLVAELDYQAVEYSRQNLLMLLESQEKDTTEVKHAILPASDKVADSFLFRFPGFRHWRNKTLPHLIPLWLLMTAAMLGVRKLLYFRAAQGAAGTNHSARTGGLPWQGA